MSGIGGGGGGGTWVEQQSDDCGKLSQQTTLNSPNRTVVSQLKKGDLLDIQVKAVGKSVVVEALHNGQVAGSVTSSIIQQLVECLEKGYEYVAEVLNDVQGGACRIHIHQK